MAKYAELRRHTDNEDDVLTPDGIRRALEIGENLEENYELLVSSGAQRATQTLGCILAAMGRKVPGGVVVELGLRSDIEDRWRAAYTRAGSSELLALRSTDPDLVDEESVVLGSALRRVFDRVSDGARVLVVGHSPTNEAAVLGLIGEMVAPMAKGAGVLIVEENGRFRVEPLR